MSKRNNCMYALPHELTGIGECCGLFHGGMLCNGFGANCAGYCAHNAESCKALAKAIAEKQKQKQKEADDGKVV